MKLKKEFFGGIIYDEQQKENELTLMQKKDLIKQIRTLGTKKISIAGGEPFICEDIFHFLKECNKYDIDVSMTTNGTLFTKEIIKKLNDIKIKNITISFDGGKEETMNFIRGKGTYNKVLKGLSLLSDEYKGKYSLKTTLMKYNINEIEEIIKIGMKYNCDMVKFNAVRDDGRASLNKNDIIINQEEYIDTIKNIELLREKYGKKIKIRAPLNIFCKEDYDYIEELGFGCFAGKESICIDPMGNVRPCSHYPEQFICGNIKEKKLTDIWNHSSILKKFRELEGNDTCNNCMKYNYCRGGCRYRCFLQGNINGVDPFCYLYKNSSKKEPCKY